MEFSKNAKKRVNPKSGEKVEGGLRLHVFFDCGDYLHVNPNSLTKLIHP
jgi:hypothetical protein